MGRGRGEGAELLSLGAGPELSGRHGPPRAALPPPPPPLARRQRGPRGPPGPGGAEDYAECSDGYEWDPETEHCKDVDECAVGSPPPCRGSMKCLNHFGGYLCLPRSAALLSPGPDVDECAGPPPCRPSQECINVRGGFECRCPPGYRHRDTECVDEDECQFRWCQHSCANSPGAFSCRCHPGFSLGPDGRSCLDVDECSMGARCSQRCLNTFGSFRCRCRAGFALGPDGHRCLDVDECRGGVRCQHRCQNLPGGFSCVCPPGYSEEGGLCKDRDECSEGSHGCGGAQSCLNTFGGHLCDLRVPRGVPGCAPRPRWLLHRFLALPETPRRPPGSSSSGTPWSGTPRGCGCAGGPPGTFRLRALTNHSSLLELVRPLAGPRQLLLEVELLRPGPRPPPEAPPLGTEGPPPGTEGPPPGAWDPPPPTGRGLALLRLHLSVGGHPF
ncbi:EGF-containing fibulin-like extracellular matrix protein 2 [Melozone crissalis]|uniref:EGF-containing fibulin-like extracellular matrix protein 2 n=1 Tax=Melozone crissalis TaxID=40204 RepID=UPI0023DA1158|nr:EGF-containing fibulin-like extracellular matrix protein 2 [Melozone crissalis]